MVICPTQVDALRINPFLAQRQSKDQVNLFESANASLPINSLTSGLNWRVLVIFSKLLSTKMNWWHPILWQQQAVIIVESYGFISCLLLQPLRHGKIKGLLTNSKLLQRNSNLDRWRTTIHPFGLTINPMNLFQVKVSTHQRQSYQQFPIHQRSVFRPVTPSLEEECYAFDHEKRGICLLIENDQVLELYFRLKNTF